MISVKLIVSPEISKAEIRIIPVKMGIKNELLQRFDLPEQIISEFKAEKSETISFYPQNDSIHKKLIFIGLGENPSIQQFQHTVRTVFHQLKNKDEKTTILLDLPDVFTPEKDVHLITIAAGLGWNKMVSYKKKEETSGKLTLELLCPEKIYHSKKIIRDAIHTLVAKKMSMDLINMPSNILGPKEFAKFAKKEADSRKINVSILKEDELQKKGFGAIMAVGQGAENQPRLIVLDYKPEKYSKTVAIIGKGVMFDTGGISIKSSTNMHYMKCDMGGAAIAFGAVCLAADLELPVRVIMVVPSVMNMLDGSAYLPGDVITAYNGNSIEIIDTDAEGRLVLADALAYAALDLKPDVMIDLATLTGSAVTALGYHSAAMMTKNEELSQELSKAGFSSGDRVWPLPMWDEYGEPLGSDVADVKNYAGPASGAIFAAKFLEKFTENHPAWVHLDVAGMVLQQGNFGKDRVATGYGVELLIEYLKTL